MSETCICCGEVIPEGRQICYVCEFIREDELRAKQKIATDNRKKKIELLRRKVDTN